jgi:hypothetical protein
MSVTPTNIVQGPATLYWGTFGTTEPADSNAGVIAAPGGGWTDFGGTQGGVGLEVDSTYGKINVDQLVDPVGARLTARMITVTATLVEATLNNLYQVMNGQAVQSSGTGYATLDPTTTTSATQPTYSGLIIDGWAPTLSSGAAARRRLIVRKVLSEAKVSEKYTLTDQVQYAVTWTAYYVSPSIAPFHIIDQTA